MSSTVVQWLPRPARYAEVWAAMQAFTAARDAGTPDEIWLCEHAPVYTLGQAGKPQHILNAGAIDVVHCDRGGQVTYHGPGQIVAYALVDLRRAGLYVRDYVNLLEQAAIDTLTELGVPTPCRLQGAPGVYVTQADGLPSKIAALGVKIRNGCTYHGVAINVDMDLGPFAGINPCGMAGMRTTDVASCSAVAVQLDDVGERLAAHLAGLLRTQPQRHVASLAGAGAGAANPASSVDARLAAASEPVSSVDDNLAAASDPAIHADDGFAIHDSATAMGAPGDNAVSLNP